MLWRLSKGVVFTISVQKEINGEYEDDSGNRSCDTKFKEAKFISDFIKNEGLNALVINTATGPAPSYNYDISREEIAESYGTPWEEMEPKSKGEKRQTT